MMNSIHAVTVKPAVSPRNRIALTAIVCLSVLFSGCETTPSGNAGSIKAPTDNNSGSAEEFFIVDCLLPGQVRQLGSSFTYLTQRRPIKTAQSDCEIRGGEYVAYDRADYSTALRIWLPLAKAGDASAQTYVGEIYEKGLGLSADYVVAAHWYGEADKQGYSRAQINLGNLYEKGLGVRQDKQKALNLYRSASGLGADHLLYASTLSTSYVPRQEYETVQRELVVEQQRGDQLRRNLGRVSSDLDQQSLVLTAAEEELRTIQTKLEQAIAAEGRVSTGAETGVASPEELELLAGVEQMESYQRDLESQMAQLQRQNSELSSSQQALVAQLSGNERAKNQYQKQIEQLEQQLSLSRQEVSRSEREQAAVSAKLAQQQSREEALTPEFLGLQRDLEAKNQALSAEQVRLAQLESERKALAGQLAVTDAKMAEYQLHIDKMQRQMDQEQQRMLVAEQEIAALKAQLAGQRSKEAELTPALLALQGDLELKNSALEAQRRVYALLVEEKQSLAEQIAGSERRRGDNEAQVAGLEQQLASTNQGYADSRREVAALRAELAELQARESSLTPELLSLQRELEEKNKVLTEERVKLATLESQNLAQQQQLSDSLTELDRTSARLVSADSSYTREKAGLDALLVEREQEMEEVRHQLLLSRASMHMERSNSEQVLAQQAEDHERALSMQQTELQQLTLQLATQFELVRSQKREIARLGQEARSYEAELAVVDNASARTAALQIAALDSAGPAIEIIEPPVVLTRSQATVRLRTFQGERQVIGRVSAPAGLLSLSVNGETPQLTENNLFRSSVPLTEDPTPVEVVLVDNEGRRVAVSFSFVNQEERKAGGASTPIVGKAHFSRVGKLAVTMGDYHALVIGNNDYRNFSTLVTAVHDARETERLLREKYRFKTKLLLNADRYTILSALNELRETLDEDDNLLIYYAGHGKLDESSELGYWLPVDAEQDNSINWISNKVITDILNVIQAKHVLVVADSCYAGTLTQTPIARVQADVPDDVRAEWIKIMAETRARITLTSGGVEPVLDGGGGRHSVFAKAFLGALRDNDGVLEGYTLYSRVLEVMASQSSLPAQSQMPQYAPIHLAGHESGEFFFNPISG
jgi:septal ring factor EnvC (AmiA/AmiB activator)